MTANTCTPQVRRDLHRINWEAIGPILERPGDPRTSGAARVRCYLRRPALRKWFDIVATLINNTGAGSVFCAERFQVKRGPAGKRRGLDPDR
jgi:hypothetical protein